MISSFSTKFKNTPKLSSSTHNHLMDYCGIERGTLHAVALTRLVQITAKKTPVGGTLDDAVPPAFSAILKGTKTTGSSDGAISKNELDTLFALCSCSNDLKSEVQAEILLSRFSNYLEESKGEVFSSTNVVRNTVPTAWTKMTYEVTVAILSLGKNFPSLAEKACNVLMEYVESVDTNIDLHGAFSLVGFLEGLRDRVDIVTPEMMHQVHLHVDIPLCRHIEDIIEETTDIESQSLIAAFYAEGSSEFCALYFVDLLGQLCMQFFHHLVHTDASETLMDHLLSSESVAYNISENDKSSIQAISSGFTDNYKYLEEGNKYTTMTSERKALANSVRACALNIACFGYVASVVPFEEIRAIVGASLESITKINTSDPDHLASTLNSDLIRSIFYASALLSESDRTTGLMIDKFFPKLLSYPDVTQDTARNLARSLTYSLKTLSEDDIVSTIYSLTNLLSDPSDPNQAILNSEEQSVEDHINIQSTALEARKSVCRNVVTSVSEITRAFNDESINILVITLLSQKLRKKPDEFNCVLLEGLIGFVDIMQTREFAIMMRYFYDATGSEYDDPKVAQMTLKVWIEFSERMAQRADSELYTQYLDKLLTAIISKGDIDRDHHRSSDDIAASAAQIVIYLEPLAHALPDVSQDPVKFTQKGLVALFRDAWFNLAIHGFAYNSSLYTKNYSALRRIAHSSPPLASESSWNRSETSIELNTVLRRSTSKSTEKLHKDVLMKIFSRRAIDTRVIETQLSKPGLVFLSANLLLEMLRVDCGNCSTSLEYLSDPSVDIAGLANFVGAVAYFCCARYIEKVRVGGLQQFIVPKVTVQLEQLLIYCCHRDAPLQSVAYQCTDRLIRLIPSSLCHDRSTFSMLDIMTLLYDSIIDADTNEYDPNVEFVSDIMKIKLSLSDSYVWRQKTLEKLTKYAREWTTIVLNKCEQDMESILQAYVSKAGNSHRAINYGVTFAIEMASKVLPVDKEFFQMDSSNKAGLNTTAGFLSQVPWRSDVESDTRMRILQYKMNDVTSLTEHARTRVATLFEHHQNGKVTYEEYADVMEELAGVIIMSPTPPGDLVRYTTELPFKIFTGDNIDFASGIWLGIIKEQPRLASQVLSSVLRQYENTVNLGIGLFSRQYDLKGATFYPMEYLPTSKKRMDHSRAIIGRSISPHVLLTRLLSSNFEASQGEGDHILKMFTRFTTTTLKGVLHASLHPMSRLARFELIYFAIDVLKCHAALGSRDTPGLINLILDASLSWFTHRERPPFGSNKLHIRAEYTTLQLIAVYFTDVTFNEKAQEQKRTILLMFLDSEISFLCSWLHPDKNLETLGAYNKYKFDERVMADAFKIDGRLAVSLYIRYAKGDPSLKSKLSSLISQNPFEVVTDTHAISFLTANAKNRSSAIVVWDSAAPIDSITHFLPPYNTDPLILQYAMRSIESFDVHQTFFYVPQIVQALRYDELGYIRRYILETGSVSQLFAHQIIWNMSANSYKDEESKVPDPIKPTLDEIKETMVKNFTPSDMDYYEKEFSFFNEVTSISGKLKPYIKKTKVEKKVKIDEEMAKIKLEEGVYLPSNPDGTVVDIDRKSGKPLQSHAKAPFLATFKIKRKEQEISSDSNEPEQPKSVIENVSAIFKVGDDCRQDVLILQLMATFRTIWMRDGLDVFLYPYRVTATAPGCGIIDVLPHSTSRDMLGREQVNGLYEYFISQFGPETSSTFQRARNNFVKSMAAYSIITYILALKDRHNGNIMYDDQGHILHIDFGFCFDIAPGGVTFEQSPFKLTKEMVQVMGGSTNTQAFRWFMDLCVKGFLTCREYMDAICGIVEPMLDSGLPCFKGATIKHLRARFVPQKNNREAAAYMRQLVMKSYENMATKGYDEFQKITNGIPY